MMVRVEDEPFPCLFKRLFTFKEETYAVLLTESGVNKVVLSRYVKDETGKRCVVFVEDKPLEAYL